MSHSRSNSGAGRYGRPNAGPAGPTGTTAVAQDCIGFRRTWPCAHHQDLLACGHGCPIADHAALFNHVHFMFDIEDDGLPCPICPGAEQPGRARLDDLQRRVDQMAQDPYFRRLQGEVAARTPAPEPVDPWRVEEPPEGEEMWRVIVTLGMRLIQMRREPRGPGSGPPLPTMPQRTTAYHLSSPAPQLPRHQGLAHQPTLSSQALANAQIDPSLRQAMPAAPQSMPTASQPVPAVSWPSGPTAPQEQPAPSSGRSRRGLGLNPVTAFRAEFFPGQPGWVHNRLSRRQAARNRAAWAVAHQGHGPFQIVQQQQTLAQAIGHPPAQPTRMQEVVTAADLEEALEPVEAAGATVGETSAAVEASREAGALGESGEVGAAEQSAVWGEDGDLNGVSDDER